MKFHVDDKNIWPNGLVVEFSKHIHHGMIRVPSFRFAELIFLNSDIMTFDVLTTFAYMNIKIFQLYQVVVKQSSSNVVKWRGGFLIGLLRKDTRNE